MSRSSSNPTKPKLNKNDVVAELEKRFLKIPVTEQNEAKISAAIEGASSISEQLEREEILLLGKLSFELSKYYIEKNEIDSALRYLLIVSHLKLNQELLLQVKNLIALAYSKKIVSIKTGEEKITPSEMQLHNVTLATDYSDAVIQECEGSHQLHTSSIAKSLAYAYYIKATIQQDLDAQAKYYREALDASEKYNVLDEQYAMIKCQYAVFCSKQNAVNKPQSSTMKFFKFFSKETIKMTRFDDADKLFQSLEESYWRKDNNQLTTLSAANFYLAYADHILQINPRAALIKLDIALRITKNVQGYHSESAQEIQRKITSVQQTMGLTGNSNNNTVTNSATLSSALSTNAQKKSEKSSLSSRFYTNYSGQSHFDNEDLKGDVGVNKKSYF